MSAIKIASLEAAVEELTTKLDAAIARITKLESAPKATKATTRSKQEQPHPYPTTYAAYVDILNARLDTFQVSDLNPKMTNDKFISSYGVYILPKLVFDYMTQLKEKGVKFGYINTSYEATLDKMYNEFSKIKFENFNDDETFSALVQSFNTELKYVGDHLKTNKPKKGESQTDLQIIAAKIKDAYKPLYQAFKRTLPSAAPAEDVARPALDA